MKREIKTLCPFCGVGCGLLATTDGEKILRVRGDPKHPANFGRVCPKGGTVAQTVNVRTRLRYPMLRQGRDPLGVVSTATAVRHVATEFDRIIQSHGPDAIAFYLSGQLTTESQYLANKFAKAYLRTNNVDSNSRLCMSSAASGYNLSFGSDGPPTCYEDIEHADVFFFVGSNAAECHPVTFERIQDRIRKKGAKCIVADPRRTKTAEAADVFLPVKPGTDLALLNGLLRLLRDAGKIDRAYVESNTEGWEDLNALLDAYPPERVAEICRIDQKDLLAAAKILIDHDNLITLWTMGVNQTMQGTYTSNAIANLHLATGRIGKPGAGPFSLTGQPNAMGGRDVGYMSHTLPGHRFVADATHRAQLERFWGLRPGHLIAEPGADAVRLFEAMERGDIKALWVIGTNPAASMPNLPRVRAALEKAELVVVQDAYYPTETTRFAHVLLPAAVNLEMSGTFCNSERRVSLMEQVVPPPGEAKPDWWWIREVGRAMGFEKGMNYTSAAEIFDEFARSTAGRPNDQSALHHELLRQMGPQCWPYPSMSKSSLRRYEDAKFHTASGKARLWARPHEELAERTDVHFPFVLTTGRTLNQWHTRTKTGLVEQLNKQDPAPYVQMHPDDATALGLSDGHAVEVKSRRGSARTHLKIDPAISPGVVFMPIHWNDLWGPSASANEATTDATDPVSKQPSLKACAVAVSGAA